MAGRLSFRALFLCSLLALPTAAPPMAAAGPDCNGNGISDSVDIAHGVSDDCNANAIPDECDLSSGSSPDCDGGEVPDECDTAIAFTAAILDPSLIHAVLWMDGGDIDGDSDPDLLANDTPFGGPKAWFQNVGGGSFVKRVFDESGAPGVIRLTDIDVDGDLDIVLAYTDITWYENTDGLGTFSAPETLIARELPMSFQRLALLDIDADGDDDIVATQSSCGGNPESSIVTWHENLDGTNAFGTAQIVHSGEYSCSSSVDAADVDGDGDGDILLANGDLQWFENEDGAGSFGAPRVFGTGYWVRTADLDSDGDQDVLAQLDWHENLDGIGNFGPPNFVTLNWSRMYAGDMDGDGDRDIVGLEPTIQTLRWYENIDGQGRLGASRDMYDDVAGGIGPVLLDFDGDGDMDAAAPHGPGVTLLENESDDCDGDGVPDVCQTDCNASGLPDICDLRLGLSADCNRDLIPDECQLACTRDCDADFDLCADEFDCDVADDSMWAEPTAALSLALHAPSTGTLLWNPPSGSGATTVRYDTLRSASPTEFHVGGFCVESDGADRSSEDFDIPPTGTAFYYLIRVENDCPGGAGSMGASASGTPRSGIDCSAP